MGASTVVRVALVLSLFIVRSARGTESCGERKLSAESLIAHGYKARYGAWPWHGAMFHRFRLGWTSYVCGATIMTEQFVLTAAHCTYEGLQMLPANRVFIKVGFSNLDSPEDHVRQFEVDKIIRHDEYEKDTFENDIALLKLSSIIAFTSYIQPVCLWQGDSQLNKITSKIGYVVGWGLDEAYNLPEHLSESTMPIVSSKTCWESDRLHYAKYYFESKTFCAGRLNSTHVSHGDSGGGLYMRMGANWILRGLVSNAKTNPLTLSIDANSYVMFTDVAYYSNWIKTKVPGIPYFAVDTERIIGIESDNKDNLLGLKNCGTDTYSSETPGKEKVFVSRHPWFAYIKGSRSKTIARFWCWGVLIHPSFLISVARCLERNKNNNMSVWIIEPSSDNIYDYDDDFDYVSNIKGLDTSTRILVRNVFVQPDYDSTKNGNDIALVELGRPTTAIPICLPTLDPFDSPEATQFHVMHKYNIPDAYYNTQHFREVAQMVDLEVCQEKFNMYQIEVNLTKGQVCSTSTDENNHFYKTYDLGSALLQYFKNSSIDGKYYLTAVATFSVTGNVSDFHTVFMNVAYYSKWIQEKLGINLRK